MSARPMSDEPMKTRLVLMVEADPVMQRHLASLLANWGYEPVLTSSVDESLAALAHNQFLFSLLDLNLDGAINVLDIQLCVNVFLGVETDPGIVDRSDLNGDGAVNVLDVQLLVNLFLAG